MDHHHPLREALVKVFKRRVFLKQPAAGSHGGAGADGSGDSKADDSDGSDSGDGADAEGNDARLDDEAVAAADPALFTKVCAPQSGRFSCISRYAVLLVLQARVPVLLAVCSSSLRGAPQPSGGAAHADWEAARGAHEHRGSAQGCCSGV